MEFCTKFLRHLETFYHSKLLVIINDAAKFRKLQIELAVTVDAMEEFVKATYRLEGDDVFVVTTYEQLCSYVYSTQSFCHNTTQMLMQ